VSFQGSLRENMSWMCGTHVFCVRVDMSAKTFVLTGTTRCRK